LNGRPRRMLLELPTADEIDEMASDRPALLVRRFDFDLKDRRMDLDYTPCKGEVLFVTTGARGVALVRTEGAVIWTLPSGRVCVNEAPEATARRIANERCGIRLGEMELMALYDVTRHYENVSIKRLLVVYRAKVEDYHSGTDEDGRPRCVFHSADLEGLVCEEIDSQAIADCLEK
jgi:ADP-ribose pyrophosphatase YjhB (NUDIX family)